MAKKCYIQVKSTENYSPVLSATHLPSAFTVTSTECLVFKTECLTMFYDIMISYTEMYCEPMQNILVNLVSDADFHPGKMKLLNHRII